MRKLEIALEVQRVVNEAIIDAPVLPNLNGSGICGVVALHYSSRFDHYDAPYTHVREMQGPLADRSYVDMPGEWNDARLMLAAMLAVIPPEDYV